MGLVVQVKVPSRHSLNAINLALDIVWRFPSMPDDFYRQWAQVASEEATHFAMLRAHLQ